MSRQALTLVELVVVMCILVAMASVLVPLCSGQMSAAASISTDHSLSETAAALEQYWSDTKFTDMDGVLTVATEANRFSIQWLFRNPVDGNPTGSFNPNSRSGWNGPYLQAPTSDPNVQALGLRDGWNNLLQTQLVNPATSIKDVRVVSAGPNGLVDIPATVATSALSAGDIGDDQYVALSLR